MESKLPTKMQIQDEQDELNVMEVEDDVDDNIPDLVDIHQAPTNANSQPAVPLTENQEALRIPVSIPELDGEAENGYWSQLSESESESEPDSDSDSNWVSDSDSDNDMESTFPTKMQSQDEQDELNVMKVEDDVEDDIPDLVVDIYQAPTNASQQAVPLTGNQEVVRMPVSIPELDGEEENRYWSQLSESESDSDSGSEQTARESGTEENEGGAATTNARFVVVIPEEMARALNNPESGSPLSNALFSILGPFILVVEIPIEPTSGMSPEEKDRIPEITVDDGPAEFEGQRTCSVCIEDFVVGERARQPICGHLFHQTCLWPWLEGNRTCPSCRHLL